MSNNRTYVHHVAIVHEVRTSARPVERPDRRADEALLRVVLGLPPGAPLRWQTCGGDR